VLVRSESSTSDIRNIGGDLEKSVLQRRTLIKESFSDPKNTLFNGL
jgi:hypothetical protein